MSCCSHASSPTLKKIFAKGKRQTLATVRRRPKLLTMPLQHVLGLHFFGHAEQQQIRVLACRTSWGSGILQHVAPMNMYVRSRTLNQTFVWKTDISASASGCNMLPPAAPVAQSLKAHHSPRVTGPVSLHFRWGICSYLRGGALTSFFIVEPVGCEPGPRCNILDGNIFDNLCRVACYDHSMAIIF